MEAYAKLAIVAMLVAAAAIVLGPSAVAAQSFCGMSGDGLIACKPAVTASNPLPPSVPCCTALESADMQCLCKYKKSQMLASLGIDPTLAMQLPVKCKLLQSIPCT